MQVIFNMLNMLADTMIHIFSRLQWDVSLCIMAVWCASDKCCNTPTTNRCCSKHSGHIHVQIACDQQTHRADTATYLSQHRHQWLLCQGV